MLWGFIQDKIMKIIRYTALIIVQIGLIHLAVIQVAVLRNKCMYMGSGTLLYTDF